MFTIHKVLRSKFRTFNKKLLLKQIFYRYDVVSCIIFEFQTAKWTFYNFIPYLHYFYVSVLFDQSYQIHVTFMSSTYFPTRNY